MWTNQFNLRAPHTGLNLVIYCSHVFKCLAFKQTSCWDRLCSGRLLIEISWNWIWTHPRWRACLVSSRKWRLTALKPQKKKDIGIQNLLALSKAASRKTAWSKALSKVLCLKKKKKKKSWVQLNSLFHTSQVYFCCHSNVSFSEPFLSIFSIYCFMRYFALCELLLLLSFLEISIFSSGTVLKSKTKTATISAPSKNVSSHS